MTGTPRISLCAIRVSFATSVDGGQVDLVDDVTIQDAVRFEWPVRILVGGHLITSVRDGRPRPRAGDRA